MNNHPTDGKILHLNRDGSIRQPQGKDGNIIGEDFLREVAKIASMTISNKIEAQAYMESIEHWDHLLCTATPAKSLIWSARGLMRERLVQEKLMAMIAEAMSAHPKLAPLASADDLKSVIGEWASSDMKTNIWEVLLIVFSFIRRRRLQKRWQVASEVKIDLEIRGVKQLQIKLPGGLREYDIDYVVNPQW